MTTIKQSLNRWCKSHGIDHKLYSDEELFKMRSKNRRNN